MGKMSQLHAELSEEAYEHGFDTLEEYLADQERTKAHEAWLEERADVLEGLDLVLRGVDMPLEYSVKIVDAMDFIKKGEQ